MKQQQGLGTLLIVILVVVILLIAGLGYYFSKVNLSTVSTNPEITPPPDNSITTGSTPDKVTRDYYNWYLSCINNHFSTPTNKKSPQQDCPYNQTGDLTNDLVTSLQQVKGYDPILCAQDAPQSLTFEKSARDTTDTATVSVITIWDKSAPHNIDVGLQQTEAGWKIYSINCNM